VLDFRGRLAAKLPGKLNTANKALAVLKTILKEALFPRGHRAGSTAGVGNLKESRKEAGVFTEDELRALFPADPPGPWKDLQGYACFLLAATTGMRRGRSWRSAGGTWTSPPN